MNILRYINSLPFPLTIKHYYPLGRISYLLKDGELNSSESWDILRKIHSQFSISEDREEWLKSAEGKRTGKENVKKDGQEGNLIQRARDVVDIIDHLGITCVFSLGVGGAGLEYQIKKIKPEVKMVCSEYSHVAVNALKKVFLECDEIVYFDARNDDFTSTIMEYPSRQLHLISRLDVDLTDEEFRDVIKRMYDSGIQNILVICGGCLTLRGLFNRLHQRINYRLHSVPLAFAGYLRSAKTFSSFWYNSYQSTEINCGGLKSFLLTLNK